MTSLHSLHTHLPAPLPPQGPIVSRIKALKTPQVLKEMRVKGMLMDHKEIKASMGVKIVAPGLEMAVAGTSLYVVGPDDSEAELKHAVMQDMADIFSKVGSCQLFPCFQQHWWHGCGFSSLIHLRLWCLQCFL